jgi:hypothetical protein
MANEIWSLRPNGSAAWRRGPRRHSPRPQRPEARSCVSTRRFAAIERPRGGRPIDRTSLFAIRRRRVCCPPAGRRADRSR